MYRFGIIFICMLGNPLDEICISYHNKRTVSALGREKTTVSMAASASGDKVPHRQYPCAAPNGTGFPVTTYAAVL